MTISLAPSVGLDAAARLHFTDPRVTALSQTMHAASDVAGKRPWHMLDWNEQHVWRTAARDWLRAAVAAGMLPLVDPTTGDALAAVPLDVRPDDGRPRPGNRGRAATYREAASLVAPEAFGYGGPDHHDAWTAAVEKLRGVADEVDDDTTGPGDTPDHLAAALTRFAVWAGQLDAAAQDAAGDRTVTDPTADVVRSILDDARHGQVPL